MIEALISSKTRIKILLKFFLNSNTSAYLRSLETEFQESTNGIRKELNRFEKAGLLTSFLQGNKKLFRANTQHPLFSEINTIVRKHLGLDQVIDKVVEKLGNVERVYLMGDFAQGKDSDIIDLLLIGEEINLDYLVHLIVKVEKLINRKLRYLNLSSQEVKDFLRGLGEEKVLLIWEESGKDE